MKVERIDVLNIYVKDLERAVKFFSELMGTRFIGPIVKEANIPPELREKAGVPGRHVRVAISKAVGNVALLLTQPTAPDGKIDKWIDERGEGLASIGLKVPDIEEAVTELLGKGFTMVGRTVAGGSLVTSVDGKPVPGQSCMKAATLTAPGNAYRLQFYLLEYDEAPGFAMGTLRKLGDLPWM